VIIVPTSNGFAVGSTAALIDEDNVARAWAERYVRKDPDIRWIVGNYVEADQANSNGHIFPLSELVVAQSTIAGKPLNMLHREHYIVGYFAGAQLLDTEGGELQAAKDEEPNGETDGNGVKHPYVEALAGLWHSRFPEEFYQIQKAHKEGSLFFSMEAIPEAVSCPTCDHEAVFAGLESDTYCDHMQGATGPKMLRRPVFSGGAIIIPPVRPGWDRADIKTISKMYEQGADNESLYAQVGREFPHLGPREWEWMMAQIMALTADSEVAGRAFTPKEREKLSKTGNATPDGAFPIKNAADLKNAIRAVGRAKNPAAAKAHIKKMARKLGLEDLIPEGW
jgi:hypothetical protein